jgi:hypothetical protein
VPSVVIIDGTFLIMSLNELPRQAVGARPGPICGNRHVAQEPGLGVQSQCEFAWAVTESGV